MLVVVFDCGTRCNGWVFRKAEDPRVRCFDDVPFSQNHPLAEAAAQPNDVRNRVARHYTNLVATVAESILIRPSAYLGEKELLRPLSSSMQLVKISFMELQKIAEYRAQR